MLYSVDLQVATRSSLVVISKSQSAISLESFDRPVANEGCHRSNSKWFNLESLLPLYA